MSSNVRNILLFLGLVLLQIFVFNNVNIAGVVTPFIYPLFILLLPFEMSLWLLLIIAFFTGLTIDIFAITGGMHAFATTLIAFLRPLVINFISIKGKEKGEKPTLYTQGHQWFILYFIILFLIHHLTYFIIETWSVNFLAHTFVRTLFSALVSIIISYILLLGFSKKT